MTTVAPTVYSTGFFDSIEADSFRSASVIVPLLVDLIKPASVIDVGCGRGVWLSQYITYGISDLIGIDGGYVDVERLAIDTSQFRIIDLQHGFRTTRRFDLAMCLEVAEHLPESSADLLIDSLITASSVVAFSAAVPGQGGTNHVNEQWHEYWHRKFASRGYVCLDVIRSQLVHAPDVAPWYKQNLFLYVEGPVAPHYSRLKDEFGWPAGTELLTSTVAGQFKSIRGLTRALLNRIGMKLSIRFGRRRLVSDNLPVVD